MARLASDKAVKSHSHCGGDGSTLPPLGRKPALRPDIFERAAFGLCPDEWMIDVLAPARAVGTEGTCSCSRAVQVGTNSVEASASELSYWSVPLNQSTAAS